MTSATKVGELFSAAGEAFAKLAELTRVLQTALNNASDDCGTVYSSTSCWSKEDTESLQLAVKRFGDELDVISEHIKDKTMCQIKSTFKKIQPTLSSNVSKPDDTVTNGNHGTSSYSSSTTTAVVGAGTNSFDELSSNTRLPGLPAGIAVVDSSPSSLLMSKSASKLPSATAGIAAAESSSMLSPQTSAALTTLSGTTAVGTTASICSSPSPFLHYPLLRKSADITLNMLNARDDSDDEDRIASLSLFNNV